MISVLYGGGWSAPRQGRFTSEKDPVPIVHEAGWAPGPVWTGAENLAPSGIISPDSPARSESLYWLSYPDPLFRQLLTWFLSVHLERSFVFYYLLVTVITDMFFIFYFIFLGNNDSILFIFWPRISK